MSTSERIIIAANDFIQNLGFEGFSYADLAEKVGIKKASIHYHFPTKNDLGIAYCQYKSEQLRQLQASYEPLSTAFEKLNAYLSAFTSCAEQREMCGIYAMLSDSCLFSETLNTQLTRLINQEQQMVKDILILGIHDKSIKAPSENCDEMAFMIISILKGSLMYNRIPPHTSYQTQVAVIQSLFSA